MRKTRDLSVLLVGERTRPRPAAAGASRRKRAWRDAEHDPGRVCSPEDSVLKEGHGLRGMARSASSLGVRRDWNLR